MWSEGWPNTTRRMKTEQSRHLGYQGTSESVMGPVTGSALCSYSLSGHCFFLHPAQALPSSRAHTLGKISYSKLIHKIEQQIYISLFLQVKLGVWIRSIIHIQFWSNFPLIIRGEIWECHKRQKNTYSILEV